MSPLRVARSQAESLGGIGTLELVPRNCGLDNYKKIKNVPEFVTSELIAYASPDSTYAVTKRLLDSARNEIIVGIYDFSAEYIKDILLNAMQRGVKVSLMLDLDSDEEQRLFDALAKFGCNAVPAPSCASENISVFPSSHEKVIVIDGTWTLVQSGNYSKSSIPLNEQDGGDPDNFVRGNRDTGLAIRSKPLAAFFSKVLRADMKLELDAAAAQAARAVTHRPEPDLVEIVPELLPSKLFPSKHFRPQTRVPVTVVLTPDNYMDVIPDFLESAKKSIYVEQQYIRSEHEEIERLLDAIARARGKAADLDVRIVLGKIFGSKDVPKERKNIANLKKSFDLRLGVNIRYIDTKRFVHCHNKMIIVDKESVLISSQNWSRTAVGTNREAGVLIRYPDLARYYVSIFESDWSTASKVISAPKKKETVTLEAVAKGNFVQVRAADYEEV